MELLKDIHLFHNMTEGDINAALKCVGAFFKEYKKDEYKSSKTGVTGKWKMFTIADCDSFY